MQTHWISNTAVSGDGAGIDVLDPATEQVLDTIPVGSTGDADAAVLAARAAQPGWAASPPAARRDALLVAASRLEAAADEIADVFVSENGKTRAEARAEIGLAVSVTRSFAELGVHLRSGAQSAAASDLVFQHRRPRGVAACIVPWNFPVMVGVENIVPNLMVGNTVVIKPSEKTPLGTRLLVERAFGHLPEGVLNVLLGGPAAGAALVDHDDVDVVVFVGSERTGRAIGEVCGRRLRKVVLELGGKDPFIVDETVDIAAAAKLCATATYLNAGQICTATERVYVHRSVQEEFLDALLAESRAHRVGPGCEADSTMGPLVDQLQLDKVATHVADAVSRGAKVHHGGQRLDRPGYFYPPTVLTEIDDEMLLMREETFGPVAPVIGFDDFDEAIALANQGRYGLAAIVCTTSAPRAIHAINSLDAGMVKINHTRGKAGGATSEPFKSSGIGHGYGVEFLQELTRQKSVHWRAQL
ncbi:MAG: aldehyde dehydrogenase family protein [Micromonosporaceae bacterium]